MSQATTTSLQPAGIIYSEQKDIAGSLYPGINYNHSGLNSVFMSLRRALGAWHPFAHRQVSGSDRVAFAPRNDNYALLPEPYPNQVNFSNHYPSHYNPYKDERTKKPNILSKTHPTDYMTPKLKVIYPPRACVRQLTYYERCLSIHNDKKDRCQNEALNILNICPNFALEDLKQGRIGGQKRAAIDENVYREAMKVSDYNKGRSIANVSTKTWRDGMKDKLRPDTMYADERYINVTQDDIDAAKARIDKKKAAGKINTTPQAIDPNPPYDWEHVSNERVKNIYD